MFVVTILFLIFILLKSKNIKKYINLFKNNILKSCIFKLFLLYLIN
jgi:hypothetical protein